MLAPAFLRGATTVANEAQHYFRLVLFSIHLSNWARNGFTKPEITPTSRWLTDTCAPLLDYPSHSAGALDNSALWREMIS